MLIAVKILMQPSRVTNAIAVAELKPFSDYAKE